MPRTAPPPTSTSTSTLPGSSPAAAPGPDVAAVDPPEPPPAPSGPTESGGFGLTDLLLLAVVAGWATNFRMGQLAGSLAGGGNVDPRALIVMRGAMVLAVLLPLAARSAGKTVPEMLRLEGRDRWLYALMGLIAVPGNQFLFIFGMQNTSTIHGALLFALSPAIAGAAAHLSGTERGTLRVWGGFALGFAGVALIASRAALGGPGALRAHSDPTLFGDLIMVGSATGWAGYNVLGARALRRRTFLEVTAITITAGTLWCAVLFALPLARTLGSGQLAEVTAAGWGALVYMAYIGALFGWVFWTRGIARIGPTRVMLYQYLVPLGTMALGVTLWNETLGPRGLVGGALIFLGVGLGRTRPRT